ncbi:carbon-nitrogen hydrolase [Mycena albidolilacea]|uniref:Carbon-nitrogen hydrolase n=1 Tax=Mycena albidolilacea TaxID=1033008 RepID=A0AAD7EDC8_9AGAR|nr:carbon-nitrogen hydrolase [Mycena albidolilacea]
MASVKGTIRAKTWYWGILSDVVGRCEVESLGLPISSHCASIAQIVIYLIRSTYPVQWRPPFSPSAVMVLIACAQMCSTDNVAHNLAISASDYIANDLHLGYLLAEPLATHTYTLGLQAIAKELGIHINAGIHERPSPDEVTSEEPGSERVFSTHVSIGPDSKVKAFYRKLHLFDIQLKETDEGQAIPREKLPRTGEHKKIIPGSVIPEPIGRHWTRRLHIILRRKGADIITLPSAFTVPTGRAHWHTLVRSVAINYQVYVIAAAQAGAHSPQCSSWGEALVFDPWGVELGRLPSIDEVDDPTQPLPPQFVLADVDLARVQSVREQITLEKRDDVYGVVGANTFVGSSVTELELQHLDVLERIWRAYKVSLGMAPSVCRPRRPPRRS